MNRPNEPHMPLYIYCQHYNLDKYTKFRKRKIPRFFPKVKITGPEDERFEQFCMYNLMMYKPASINNPIKEEHQTWSEAIIEYLNTPESFLPSYIRTLIAENTEPRVNSSFSSNEYEDTDYEDPDHNILPDFVHAGLIEQMPNTEQSCQVMDPHEYWNLFLYDQAVNAYKYVITAISYILEM